MKVNYKLTRTLKDGTIVNELDDPIILIVKTKCPSKYKLVDLETGQEYVGQDPTTSDNTMQWRRINGTSLSSE